MQITVETVVQFNEEATRAQRLADDATARRNEAVLMLLEAGEVRQVELARRLGVTAGRVSQIAAAGRARRDARAEDERNAVLNTARIADIEAA